MYLRSIYIIWRHFSVSVSTYFHLLLCLFLYIRCQYLFSIACVLIFLVRHIFSFSIPCKPVYSSICLSFFLYLGADNFAYLSSFCLYFVSVCLYPSMNMLFTKSTITTTHHHHHPTPHPYHYPHHHQCPLSDSGQSKWRLKNRDGLRTMASLCRRRCLCVSHAHSSDAKGASSWSPAVVTRSAGSGKNRSGRRGVNQARDKP